MKTFRVFFFASSTKHKSQAIDQAIDIYETRAPLAAFKYIFNKLDVNEKLYFMWAADSKSSPPIPTVENFWMKFVNKKKKSKRKAEQLSGTGFFHSPELPTFPYTLYCWLFFLEKSFLKVLFFTGFSFCLPKSRITFFFLYSFWAFQTETKLFFSSHRNFCLKQRDEYDVRWRCELINFRKAEKSSACLKANGEIWASERESTTRQFVVYPIFQTELFSSLVVINLSLAHENSVALPRTWSHKLL